MFIFYPLEQGLRRDGRKKSHFFHIVYLLSIRTRIKTSLTGCPLMNLKPTFIFYPLEQGLRHQAAEYKVRNHIVFIFYPLEQGLRLWRRARWSKPNCCLSFIH